MKGKVLIIITWLPPYSSTGYGALSAEQLRKTVYDRYISGELNENAEYGYGDLTVMPDLESSGTEININGSSFSEGFYVLQCVIERYPEYFVPDNSNIPEFGNLSEKAVSEVFRTPLKFKASDITATVDESPVYEGTPLTPEVKLIANLENSDTLRKNAAAEWLAAAKAGNADFTYSFKKISECDGTVVAGQEKSSTISGAGIYGIYASCTFNGDTISDEILGNVVVYKPAASPSLFEAKCEVSIEEGKAVLGVGISGLQGYFTPSGSVKYEYSLNNENTWVLITDNRNLSEKYNWTELGNAKGKVTLKAKQAKYTKKSITPVIAKVLDTKGKQVVQKLGIKDEKGKVAKTVSQYKVTYKNSSGKAVTTIKAKGTYTITVTPVTGNFTKKSVSTKFVVK